MFAAFLVAHEEDVDESLVDLGDAVNMLISILLVTYRFFFYVEQKQVHDDGKPHWHPAGMAAGKQWMIYGSLVTALTLLPTLATALDLVPSAAAETPVVVKQPAKVKATAPVKQVSKKAAPAKPAAKASEATLARKTESAPQKARVDADAHRIKAPKVDIASLRDPFESYLAVIEKQSRERKKKVRAKVSTRSKEPLEAFDLSALKLVAIMKMGEIRAAMVEDSEGKGYVVRKGSYIGRDGGRVVEITARDVVIMEDDFSPAGEPIKHKATLTLNEVNQ